MLRPYSARIALLITAFAVATPAAAELAFSGKAQMGLVFDGEDLKPAARVRVYAHAYGVTDGGLEYGMVVKLYDEELNTMNPRPPRGTAYIQSGNHSLRIGAGAGNAANIGGTGIDKMKF